MDKRKSPGLATSSSSTTGKRNRYIIYILKIIPPFSLGKSSEADHLLSASTTTLSASNSYSSLYTDTTSIAPSIVDPAQMDSMSLAESDRVSLASGVGGRVNKLVKTYEETAAAVTSSLSSPTSQRKSYDANESTSFSDDSTVKRHRIGSMVSDKSATLPYKGDSGKKKEVTRTRSLKLSERDKMARNLSQYSLQVDHSASMMNLRENGSGGGGGGGEGDFFTSSEGGPRMLLPSPSMTFEDQELMQDEDMIVEESLIPWVQTVDKMMLNRMTRKEIRRQELIHELIYTERNHVKKLKTLYQVPT